MTAGARPSGLPEQCGPEGPHYIETKDAVRLKATTTIRRLTDNTLDRSTSFPRF